MAASLAETTIEVDAIMCSVANAICEDDQVERLGEKLKIQPADVRRFKQTNHKGPTVTAEGTKDMLRQWAERISMTDALPALKAALTAAGLVRIAEMHVPASLSSVEQEQCKLKRELPGTLKECYKHNHLQLRPWQKKNVTSFEDLHVRIALHLQQPEDRGETTKKIPLKDPNKIFTVKNGAVSHIILLAAAGHGKTTTLSKFAYDWANEGKDSPLDKFPYVFLLKLRLAKKDSTLGDVIIAQLLKRLKVISQAGIERFIRENQGKCCFLLDGYDEFSGSIVAGNPQTCLSSLGELMLGEEFPKCHVVVTTRHNRKVDFEHVKRPTEYAIMEIEGFAEEDVKTYVRKFFHDASQDGEAFIKYINTQDNLNSLVNIPFFCMALCNMEKTGFLKDIGTTSKLFAQLTKYLVYHGKARTYDDSIDYSEQRINSMIVAVGEVALKKINDNREQNLIFRPEDFKECEDLRQFGVEVGLLSEEESVCDDEEVSYGNTSKKTTEFSHKLIQEYCAGVYFASLEVEQHNMITEKLEKLESAEMVLAFDNVLQFTVGSSNNLIIPIAERINTVWKEEEGNDSQRLLLRLLSELTNSVGDDLSALLQPHFKEGTILYVTGNEMTGLLKLPPKITQHIHHIRTSSSRVSDTLATHLAGHLASFTALRLIDMFSLTISEESLIGLVDAARSIKTMEDIEIWPCGQTWDGPLLKHMGDLQASLVQVHVQTHGLRGLQGLGLKDRLRDIQRAGLAIQVFVWYPDRIIEDFYIPHDPPAR